MKWNEYRLHDVYECNHQKKHRVRIGRKRYLRLTLLGLYGWLDDKGYCLEYYPTPLNESLKLSLLGVDKKLK